MAINFPDSPANGAVYTYAGKTFIYDTSKSKWTISNISLESVSSDILPDVDSSRSLGSSTKKWKELYLSGNTLFLGDSGSISSGAGGEISLPSIKIGTGSDAVKLQATGGTLKTANATSGTENAKSGTTTVANLTAMQTLASPIQGDIVNVTANNTIYMYTGTGWFKIATVSNESPTAITGVNSSYGLATDGTPTIIDVVSTDPEGATLIYNYSVISGSLTNGGGTTATVAQGSGVNTNRFTITPTQTSGYGGNFNLRFTATDNINVVNSDASFTLSFVVQNSRYTALSVKATATGSNQTFDDASTSNHTITASGSIVASTFSPHRHGGYSLKFENSASDDNNIKFNNISGAGQVETAGEFCVETWVKFTIPTPAAGSPNARIFASDGSGGNASWNLQLFPVYGNNFAGAISIYTNTYVYNADGVASASEIINDGQWHHIAVTRDSSNNLRLFSDGSLVTTVTNTTTFKFRETRLGKRDGGTGATCFTGDMRDTRVVIGSSVYESAFTPPTEPLTAITNTHLLVGDLPYIKDESTNNFSIHAGTFNNGTNVRTPKKSPISLFDNAPYSEAAHGASIRFNGLTGDYISAANHADFNVGSSDFTLECWAYIESINGNAGICGFYTTTGDQRSYIIYQTSGTEHFGVAMSSNGTYQSGSGIDSGVNIIEYLNQWVHLALTKSGTNATLYLNGNSIGTTSSAPSTLHASTGEFFVGKMNGNNIHTTGYFSDVRLVNGSVVYSSNFTPPTAPLTAITNTKFLLNPETSISDLSQKSHIACSGDAATSTTQVKFAGTKSIYLDGTGDYISIKPMLEFGEKDWTFETWVYLTSTGSSQHLFSRGPANSTTVAALSINPNGIPSVQLWDGSSDRILSSGSTGDITANTWHHVVLTHTYTSSSSNTYKIWVDGSQVTSITHTSGFNWSWSTLSGTPLLLGAYGYNNGQTGEMYLQDSRLTIGLVRYTSTFTPPTSELQG